MKRIATYIVLPLLGFIVSIPFFNWFTQKTPSVDWQNVFDGISALGAVFVPLAVVYIENQVNRTRIRIESENAVAIQEMKEILEANQKVLSSVKEFENTYGEDIKELARVRRSSDNILSGEMHGSGLNLSATPTR